MRIIKNNLRLDVPEFVCDRSLGDVPYPLSQQHHFYGFIAPPASGKTSTMISLIGQKKPKPIYRKKFHNVVLVMPQQSINSMKNNIFKHLPPEKIYNELTNTNLNQIHENVSAWSDEGLNNLIIMDDMGAYLKGSAENVQILKNLAWNRRHLKTSVWMLQQSLNSCDLSLRKVYTHLFIWKVSKKEWKLICEEYLPFEREFCDQLYRFVYTKPHDFLFIDLQNMKLFKNFDEIILSDDEIDNELEK